MKARAAEQLVAGGLKDTARVQAESATTGRAALVGAVEELTGLTVDHYAEINLFGFHNLTTAIGGVDVCLKAAVNDELSGARFPAGPQTISGADALSFVRQRHGLPGGDLSRIRRQQVFLAAVADKVLSGETLADPTRFGALVEVLQKSVVIDSGWDLLAFAQQASRIAAGNLKFLTIPTRGTQTNDRGDVVLVDPDEVHDFVEQQIAEQENAGPATVTATAPEPPAAAPPPLLAGIIAGRYVVDVRNASERVGLASAVGTHVRDLGFIRGTVDNTDPAVESTVRYNGPDGDAAEALAEQLGGIAVASDSEITQGHLLVMLGSDFDPAKVPALAAASPGTPSTPGSPGAPAAKDLSTPGVPCVD
jgi:LCP family protein required for cell wall assembly